ncbi:methyltransferase domain-containing protein [Litoribacter ruber]|uniref:methyltransferase domain-containing protein n=1 Tax=Litoribacter ruber TaxID=702568 RepID=UPI001FE80BCF|nr:methyltransferase domain-containing protein [Litoribacter ruber]
MKFKSFQDWNTYGDSDPFFGVLSSEKFKVQNLTEKALEEFYSSGVEYVDETIERISTCFDASLSELDILDFGCGVGRLAVPFAKRTSKEVIGLDISEGMVNQAKILSQKQKLDNINFIAYSGLQIPEIGQFDLVNSYIVIQHIEKQIGFDLIDQLCQKAKIGGYVQLQIPFGHNIQFWTYLKFSMKVHSGFYNKLTNLIKHGKFQREPVMQMNYYKEEKLRVLFSKYADKVHTFPTDHGGHLGNIYLFQRVR